MRAAIYTRYSSALQSPSSIEDQQRLGREFAERHGLTICEVYADREMSGAVADRPGYQAMLAAARRREFDAIITEDQSRLWRDEEEMHHALKRLRFLSIQVFSATTGSELTGEAGRMVAAITGLKTSMDLEEIKRRTRRGLRGQIERGFSAGGPAYGYRSEPVYNGKVDGYGKPVAEGYRTVIEPEEAKIIRRVFEMYAEGMSAKRIVLQLNAEAIPPARARKGRKVAGWGWTTIQGSRKRGTGILNNELYRGVRVWNRHEKVRNPENGNKPTMRLRPPEEWVRKPAPELRIISDELWNAVKARQEEMSKASHYKPGGPRPKHLFSGLLRCGKCGAHYVMLDGRSYGCGFNADRGEHVCDNTHRVRRDKLETSLLSAIEEQVFTSANVAYMQRQVEATLKRLSAKPTPDRKALEQKSHEAEGELENIKAAIRRGILTESTREMLVAAEERIRSLRAELSAKPKAQATVTALPGLVQKSLRDLRSVLGRDTDRARTLLAGLLGEIVLRPDKRGLVAELQGRVLAGSTGSGGRI